MKNKLGHLFTSCLWLIFKRVRYSRGGLIQTWHQSLFCPPLPFAFLILKLCTFGVVNWLTCDLQLSNLRHLKWVCSNLWMLFCVSNLEGRRFTTDMSLELKKQLKISRPHDHRVGPFPIMRSACFSDIPFPVAFDWLDTPDSGSHLWVNQWCHESLSTVAWGSGDCNLSFFLLRFPPCRLLTL